MNDPGPPRRNDRTVATGGLQRIRAAFSRNGVLERRLFAVAALAVLPLAVLSIVALLLNTERQQARLENSLRNNAEAMVAMLDAELGASITALQILATSPHLARQDFEAFHRVAVDLVSQHSRWTNIVLSDSRRQIVNARLPFGQALDRLVEVEAIRATFATGEPGVVDVWMSPALQRHAFGVRVPVRIDGTVRYVLTGGLDPQTITRILKRQDLPAGGVVAVFDRNLMNVSRSLNDQDAIGKPPSASLLEQLRQSPEGGLGLTHTLEGQLARSVWRRSELHGWTVAIGIPVSEFEAPLRRSLAVLGVAVVLSVVVGLLAAGFAARSVTEPLHQLDSAARALLHGQSPPFPPDTRLPQVAQAMRTLQLAHTERAQMLEQERQARNLAERANAAKDQFLAMLAHELRNPLAAIRSAAAVLARTGGHGDSARNAIEITARQAAHLARLTDDLLDASRLMTGKIQLQRRPLDLADVVRSAVQTVSSTPEGLDRTIRTEIGSAPVIGDPVRLEQVVVNLLSNALKHTPPEKLVSVRTFRTGNRCIVEVADQGAGIAPELLSRIFESFVQAPQGLDRSAGGLGVGLTIARNLVELHKGFLRAESAGIGRGSLFVVELAAAAEALPTASAPSAAPSSPRRILLVEDNGDARRMLSLVLRMNGHEVLEASDGDQALKLLQQRPDIAFVDIGLPRITGYELARRIRADIPHPPKLVALSGYGTPEAAEQARVAGFDSYLVKPADIGAIERLIRELLV